MTSSADFYKYLEQNAYPELTREQVLEREAKERRQRAVDAGNWPITSADKASIVAGTLKDYGKKSALSMARRWHSLPESQHGVFLVLLGLYGRGKTVAACSLLADHGGTFVDAPELVRLRTSRNDRDTERYDYLLRSRLVVLDDLGAEAMDDAGLFTFTQFVNRRQSGCKTIITSNLADEAALIERYTERAMARVKHVGHVVEVEGQNLRKGATP